MSNSDDNDRSAYNDYVLTAAVVNLVIIGTSVLHLLYINHHMIQRRNPTIFIVSAVACLITVNFQIASYDPFYQQLPYPCVVRGLISVPISPLYAFCLLLRSMQLVYMSCINNIRVNSFRKLNRVETVVLWIYKVFNRIEKVDDREDERLSYSSSMRSEQSSRGSVNAEHSSRGSVKEKQNENVKSFVRASSRIEEKVADPVHEKPDAIRASRHSEDGIRVKEKIEPVKSFVRASSRIEEKATDPVNAIRASRHSEDGIRLVKEKIEPVKSSVRSRIEEKAADPVHEKPDAIRASARSEDGIRVSLKDKIEPIKSSVRASSRIEAIIEESPSKLDPMKHKMSVLGGSKSDLANLQIIAKPYIAPTGHSHVKKIQSSFTQGQNEKGDQFVYGSVFRPNSIFKMCLIVFMVVFFVSAILQTSNLDSAFEPYCEMWILLPASITFAFFVLCMPFTLAVIKDIEYDLGIKFELKLSMASFMICFPFYFAVGYFLPQDTSLRLGLGPSIYYTFPNAFSHLVCSLMPFRYILFRKKKLQGDRKGLLAATNNPEDFQHLKEIMAKDFCVENIMFYEDFTALKTKLNLNTANKVSEHMTGQVQMSLKTLYTKYVSRDAALELNVCLPVLNRLRERSVNNKDLPIDLFEQINAIIFETIYRHQFQQFLMEKKLATKKVQNIV